MISDYASLFSLLTLAFSLNYLVVTSKIFSGIRNFFLVKFHFLGELLSCLQCMGFWSGVIFSCLSYYNLVSVDFTSISFSTNPIVSIILFGLLSSLYSVVVNSAIGFLNMWR